MLFVSFCHSYNFMFNCNCKSFWYDLCHLVVSVLDPTDVNLSCL